MESPMQMFKKIFNLTLAVIGVPVNLTAILVLLRGKCGLSSCSIRYMLAMASGDLMCILIEIGLRQLRFSYYPQSFLKLTPVCSVVRALENAAVDLSVWFTVMFTVDRFVAICSHKLKVTYCTNKTAVTVLATTTILLCLKNVPVYFTLQHRKLIDNVPWGCYVKKDYFTDPRWRGFAAFSIALTPMFPIALILILNAMIFRRILMGSRSRNSFKGQNKGDKQIDPEIESRRTAIILLFSISISFIILWSLYVLYLLHVIRPLLDVRDYYKFVAVAYMLRNLSCCTNTFIYAVTQPKFREELKRILKYPFTSITAYID
ncbi:probable G-protein coupled receptor 139 [Scyliorhinus canicula]|uniref:probable G-protein coupled receptor 139 n=1 Tax=Scyliorhinus canicula TaxID=7830 RepID=UPI0018F4C5AC|nr:probable G-protein coupled receptor 139 [Scyliorhinus canicula]